MATLKLIKVKLILILICCIITIKGYIQPHIKFTSNLMSIRQGENITLICNHPNGSSKNLRIRPGDKEFKILNDTAIELNVFNTYQYYPSIAYECLENGSVEKRLTINVYRKLEITEFDCFIFLDNKLNVTCEITLPFKHENDINYSVIREYPNPDTKPLNCITKKNKVNCEFGHLYSPHKFIDITKRENYNFTFQMKDNFGTITKTLLIKKNEMVKLSPADIPYSETFSNRICLNISGDNYSESFYNWNVEWHIEVKNQTDNSLHFSNKNCKIPKFLWTKNTDIICCLDELHPHRQYNVSVNRRFENSSIAHWSNVTIGPFITLCDIPAQPPFLRANWFNYDTDEKTLSIYWKQLSEEMKNGPNFHYDIRINGSKRIVPHFIDNNSAIINDWDTDGNYIISVASSNKCGVSKNSNILNIPQLKDVKLIQQLAVKHYKKNNTLIWYFDKLIVDSNDLNGFTIFWCYPNLKDKRRCLDSKSIEYIDVNANQRYYNMSNLDTYQYINIAVSPNFKIPTKNGGLNWILIDYDMNKYNNKINNGNSLYFVFACLSICGIIIAYAIYKKLLKMAQIRVQLPESLKIILSDDWTKTREAKDKQIPDDDIQVFQLIQKDEPIANKEKEKPNYEPVANKEKVKPKVVIETDRNNYVEHGKKIELSYVDMTNKIGT